MTPEHFIAMATFAFTTVITPGPNNLMLLTSGVNFGLRRSVPHMFGVILGFPLMIVPVGLGVMQIFDIWPLSYTLLTAASVAYLLFLAYRVATAAPPDGDPQAGSHPLTFVQAAAFQWVNPKAWSMALSAITLYATGRDLSALLWVTGTYIAVGCVSATSWTVLGQRIRGLLTRPALLRSFNVTMAVLLVAAMVPVLLT